MPDKISELIVSLAGTNAEPWEQIELGVLQALVAFSGRPSVPI